MGVALLQLVVGRLQGAELAHAAAELLHGVLQGAVLLLAALPGVDDIVAGCVAGAERSKRKLAVMTKTPRCLQCSGNM